MYDTVVGLDADSYFGPVSVCSSLATWKNRFSYSAFHFVSSRFWYLEYLQLLARVTRSFVYNQTTSEHCNSSSGIRAII